jgi:DNA mismatch repair protein MutS2
VLSSLRQKLKDLSRTSAIGRDEVRTERQDIDALARKLEAPAPAQLPEGPAAVAADLRPGDRVRVPRLNRSGTVLFVHRDELEIDAGGLKLRLPASETVSVKAAPDQKTAATSGWSADLDERGGAADRLNLLGMHVDEALAEVERFIDRAGYQNLQQVTVIHGLGTGALKAAVTGYLKGHALVSSLRTGEPSEGGAGVTVVELKR